MKEMEEQPESIHRTPEAWGSLLPPYPSDISITLAPDRPYHAGDPSFSTGGHSFPKIKRDCFPKRNHTPRSPASLSQNMPQPDSFLPAWHSPSQEGQHEGSPHPALLPLGAASDMRMMSELPRIRWTSKPPSQEHKDLEAKLWYAPPASPSTSSLQCGQRVYSPESHSRHPSLLWQTSKQNKLTSL